MDRVWKGGVAVSEDGGKSWTPTVKGMGFDTPSTSIVLDENNTVRFAHFDVLPKVLEIIIAKELSKDLIIDKEK